MEFNTHNDEDGNLNDRHLDAEHVQLVPKLNVDEAKDACHEDRKRHGEYIHYTGEGDGPVQDELIGEHGIEFLSALEPTVEHAEDLEVRQEAQ